MLLPREIPSLGNIKEIISRAVKTETRKRSVMYGLKDMAN
jgi:hypothetical protein